MSSLSIASTHDWAKVASAPPGWSTDALARLGNELTSGGSTALMLIAEGELAYQWGDVALKSSIASVRKSLISLLYGIAIAEGRITLEATLADLGIDDIVPLTPEERRAIVADLLMARSGVYLPSVYDTAFGRPLRGSHAPGSFWFYNNWDFNVLGTIYETQLGETVFEAFARRIAAPLPMQDFTVEDGRYQRGPESSHPVYKLRLSARDLARVGLLCLRGGRWGRTQVVPETWIQQSTQPLTEFGGGRGYGYLWWTAAGAATGDSMSIDVPLYYASGAGGQYIIVLPALDLVVVHRAASVDRGISHDRMGEILRLVRRAMPV